MNVSHRPALVLSLLLATFLAGCVSPSLPRMEHGPLPEIGKSAARPDGSLPEGDIARAPAQITPGTGQLINERAAAEPPPSLDAAGQATFNFEGESVHAVVKAVLGDLLQQNYVIAPGVQGTVTLATPKPVSPSQALSLLEMVLGWNNARLVWSDGRYNVVPADQALAGNLPLRSGSPADARGYEVRAVPLRFIAASEMEKLIKPYARDKAVVQVDNARNLIVLAGTRAELQNYLRTVDIFDVDWLAGMSVGVFPLQSGDASKMVTSLEKVFGEGGKTPLAGMFRFMPLDGQNAVLVITPQAKYLSEIGEWIERLDTGGDGARLYVYDVKYMKATDLADQLASVYGGGSSRHSSSRSASVMPGLEPVEARTDDNSAGASRLSGNTGIASGNSGGSDSFGSSGRSSSSGGSSAGSSSTTLQVGGTEVGVSAVEESNALLVRAAPAQWESIRRAIDRLDTMPLQVHIEAQVVEVKLTGALTYGVSWFFGNDIDSTIKPTTDALTRWKNSGSSVPAPGANGTQAASFTFLGPSAQAIINTLDSVSDVRVLSAPSVLVRNNVQADFSSGTQIPVASTILNTGGNSSTDNTYSQVQFRQTGVSLKVRPRVSANGMVFLEVNQDVSSLSQTGPTIGGNVSVDNRKLHTEVAVQSGQTVMLAGLIKTDQSNGSSGIPYLSRLPVVGALFGTKTNNDNREEVLVLITPTVVRDPAEARKLTDEYGERFRALEPLRKAEKKAAPAPR